MLYEFTLRCGEDAIIKIKENWKKVVPRLLQLCNATSDDDDDECKALKIIDKELRSSGMTAKAAAVFSFHEVGSYVASDIVLITPYQCDIHVTHMYVKLHYSCITTCQIKNAYVKPIVMTMYTLLLVFTINLYICSYTYIILTIGMTYVVAS